jgi:hypothetical protein
MNFYFSFNQKVYFYFTWVLHKFSINHKGATDIEKIEDHLSTT